MSDETKIVPQNIATELAALDAVRAGKIMTLPVALSFYELRNSDLTIDEVIITGVLDRRTKTMIVGKAKSGKTFFGLTLAVHIASGTELCGLEIPQAWSVLYVNYELRAHKLVNRLNSIIDRRFPFLDSENEARDLVATNLHVINLRGLAHTPEELANHIIAEAKLVCSAVIILDPLYLIFEGNENDSHAARAAVTLIDKIIEESGAALVYVHHDVKGRFPGEKANVDRGSGSGLLGRHWDSQISLTQHADSEGAIVLDFENRDDRPHDSMTLERTERGCFACSDLLPVKENKKSANQDRLSIEDQARYFEAGKDFVIARLKKSPRVLSSELRHWIQSQFGLSDRKTKQIVDEILEVESPDFKAEKPANNKYFFRAP